MSNAFYIAALLCLLYACATPSSPEGGPRDTTAPALIQEKSSAPLQTNESSRTWYFEFDEFVELDKPGQNILVSPPLTYPLDARVYGKKVQIKLDDREQLQENTTYIINFGRSIKDITEGNSTTGLQHIFSTGPVIDSLSISGRIIQAYYGEVVSDAAILLYDNLQDSAFLLEKPLYLSFPDSSGVFRLNYLRGDTFQLFALRDENANLKYDGPPEALAYKPGYIFLDSSMIIDTPLILFEEESTPRLEDYNFASGLLTLKWSHAFLDTPSISFSGLQKEHQQIEEKEVLIWYSEEPEINCRLFIEKEEGIDTIKLRYTSSQDRDRDSKFLSVSQLQAGAEGTVLLETQVPVVNYNPDSIFFLQDTTLFPFQGAQMRSPFSMELVLPQQVFSEGGILILDNGALEEFRGNYSDSTNLIVRPFDKEALGNLFLTVDTLNPDIQYIVELRKSNDAWRQSATVQGIEIFRDSFYYLQPGKYEVEIIEDLDRNGRWSSGRYFDRVLPEAVLEVELEELKENWDLEARVKVNPFLKSR